MRMQTDDLPLHRLRPFEAAARLESFTRAAEELGLTQTAVSRQIGQLEAELGLRLFERRNRAVFLTEEGRRLAQVVGDALAAIRAEIAAIRGSRDPDAIVLRCQLCEAFYWLMPRLSRFHARHPEIQLQLVSALAPLTEATSPFDVALQTTDRASGSARLLFTAADAIFPVCAPSLPGDLRTPLAPEALLERPLLSHRVTPQDWFDWPDWFAAAGLAGRQGKTTDRLFRQLSAGSSGRGRRTGHRAWLEQNGQRADRRRQADTGLWLHGREAERDFRLSRHQTVELRSRGPPDRMAAKRIELS